MLIETQFPISLMTDGVSYFQKNEKGKIRSGYLTHFRIVNSMINEEGQEQQQKWVYVTDGKMG